MANTVDSPRWFVALAILIAAFTATRARAESPYEGRNFRMLLTAQDMLTVTFTDPLPVSNADIAPTLAHILGLHLPSTGKLQGRVLEEALPGGPTKARTRHAYVTSLTTAAGKATTLHYQELHGRRYFDSATLN